MSKQLKTYTTRIGKSLDVDISDEAIQKFGNFKHGDRVTVTCLFGAPATVAGVAPHDSLGKKEDTLWYILDKEPVSGRISHGHPWEEGDLIPMED